MRLRQLKLAGFKSFVDPVVVPFPGQLVAVVGPNGCGKSNIIDAVRWVMGESHAKNLRGESMVDVIFKGAASRKPVGQAFVELIFDNSMGRLTGPYASYQDIAIKRLVTRDGESSFFLNGTRCRRRDVMDIFLGTGAGARSYSIIGQDTISRLIEARPEELRGYLEEAAGVSKYKERRRETLQRIAHTRENLSRVSDIQSELAKQLSRLERQAKAAVRYTTLKQEERQIRTEISTLKWRHLMSECELIQQQKKDVIHQHDLHQATIATLHQTIATLEEERLAAQLSCEQIQQTFYQLATEIARTEEAIQQQGRDKRQIESDQAQLSLDLAQIQQQLHHDQQGLTTSEEHLGKLTIELAHHQTQLTQDQQALETIQQTETEWKSAWQETATVIEEAKRRLHFVDIQLQQLNERDQQLQVNVEKNQSEQSAIDIHQLQETWQHQLAQKNNVEAEHRLAQDHYQSCVSQGNELRHRLSLLEKALHQAQDETQAIAMEHAALTAAQQAALSSAPDIVPGEQQSRVLELIQVEAKWMQIAECILGDHLQAVVVESTHALSDTWRNLQGQQGMYTQTRNVLYADSPFPRLSEKIAGPLPCSAGVLEHIFIADNLNQALALLPKIEANQSIATQDGYWLGDGWVRIFNFQPDDENNQGLLMRQQILLELDATLKNQRVALATLTKQRDEMHVLLMNNEQEQATLKGSVADKLQALHANDLLVEQKKQAYEYATYRVDKLRQEQSALQTELECNQDKHHTLDAEKALVTASFHEATTKQQQLSMTKASWEAQLNDAKQRLEQTTSTTQTLQMQHAKETATLTHRQDQIKRATLQQSRLKERQQNLQQRANELAEPNLALQDVLVKTTQAYHHSELQLRQTQQQLNDLQQRLQEAEQLCKYEDRQIKERQTQLQSLQLQEQTAMTKAESLVDLLDDLDENWRGMLNILPDDVPIETREHDVLKVNEQIQKLGAINLLAIEEYQADLQRKEHLDVQFNDLTEALTTLERAIAKMDQETTLRMQETFDQVNSAFQTLFPKLFGGGHAALTLVGDNMLEAGVLVMAQPPGKRNNTIYMLSGGEKAMTAVALLFAIFQLNPSPFCMLDEVDAPLDEANIRRFCDLVKEMSQVVQFLFVTHNKVTMELANHLVGVTMREPGVSRIVSVDVMYHAIDGH